MNQEMEEREERYRLISTVASDYMFSNKVDENGNIYINWVTGAFELITGYTIEEYIAIGGWRATIHPDDLVIDDKDMEVLKANQPLITEIRTLNKNGQTVWVRVYAHPIWDKTQNKLTGIYGAVQDITERKRIELEIRQMNVTLEQRVVERTKELENAKIRAEDADRIKSAFLATMSHELRTPLNSILGFTGILLMGLVGPLEPEQEKQLNVVQDSARHLLELINDVLDISKIEAGQIELMHESFDMQAAVQKSIEKMKPLAEKKGLSLSYSVSPDVTTLRGDRRRVEQVMLNLLSNAIKFTEQGEVNLQCSIKNGQVVTSISDTGIGIKKEQMESLFQPFKQLESGITRQHDGTGLGLSISRRLIELMEGTIWVESEWGKGSCFTFSLPNEGISK